LNIVPISFQIWTSGIDFFSSHQEFTVQAREEVSKLIEFDFVPLLVAFNVF